MTAAAASSRTLGWYLDSMRGMSLQQFLAQLSHPVLLHSPSDTSGARVAWKTQAISLPDGASLRTSVPKRFDLTATMVMPVQKSERNPYQDRVYLGRAQSNDMIVEEQGVSKSHAYFSPVAGGGWTLTDVGSRNGTTVGPTQLAAHAATHLPGQCAILFGLSYLTYYNDATSFWALLHQHA